MSEQSPLCSGVFLCPQQKTSSARSLLPPFQAGPAIAGLRFGALPAGGVFYQNALPGTPWRPRQLFSQWPVTTQWPLETQHPVPPEPDAVSYGTISPAGLYRLPGPQAHTGRFEPTKQVEPDSQSSPQGGGPRQWQESRPPLIPS